MGCDEAVSSFVEHNGLWTYTIFGANDEDYVTGDEHMAVPSTTDESAKPGGLEGKKISDLIEDDVSIAWNGVNGTVTGTLKNVSEAWTQFDPKSNNTGHFFPIKIDDNYKGKTLTFYGSDGTSKTSTDLECVVRVDNYIAKGTKFIVECDGKVILSLDFSKATLAQASEAA